MHYKLTITPAMELNRDSISFLYREKCDLDTATDNMANLLLFIQDDVKAMPACSNVFFKEHLIDGEWEEID